MKSISKFIFKFSESLNRILGFAMIFVAMSFLPSLSMAQATDQMEDVVSNPDVKPEYQGGNSAMFEFIQKNTTYPEQAKKEKVSGTVYVSFVIDKMGRVTQTKVVRGISHGCSEEAVRVVNAMPNWTPGTHAGKAVNVLMNLPVKFALQ